MQIIDKLIYFSGYFFLAYLIIYATYILISAIGGTVRMYQYRKRDMLQNYLEHEFYYPMSIIVPAYNEGTVILQTVKNLMHLDYKLFEIIIVDDGSKDNTKELVINTFDMVKEENRPIRYKVPCKNINEIYIKEINGIKVTLISKDNGGCKADAVNAGINVSSYPYIVNMDADEILQKNALKIAGRSILEDDNVVAVGGNLKMSNYVTFKNAEPVETKMGGNLIVDMQVVEYGRAFVGSRIFQNESNANLIVSGGYGIFKKSALIEVGGYDTKSMGEDMEVTVKLHKHFRSKKIPYKIKYSPNSVCWTQGPDNIQDLRKQRQRWYCGLIQTLWKYKSMLFNPKYGVIGLFQLPYTVLYELLNPIIMLWGFFIIVYSLVVPGHTLPFSIALLVVYFVFGVLLSLVSFWDKIYMENDGINTRKFFMAMYTTIIDLLFFRMYISVISFLAIFKMRSLSKKWVSPRRVVVQSSEDE